MRALGFCLASAGVLALNFDPAARGRVSIGAALSGEAAWRCVCRAMSGASYWPLARSHAQDAIAASAGADMSVAQLDRAARDA